MTTAYVNRIATAVPPHECHEVFLRFARGMLAHDRRSSIVFERMADKAQIARRYSCLEQAPEGAGSIDAAGLFTRGRFGSTGARMAKYEAESATLAVEAVGKLGPLGGVTHLVATSCTGFAAPGIDFAVLEHCGIDGSVERTSIGFMGCHAAINALKVARHIVRSEPKSRVLVINLELCTLHLQETTALEQVLCFLLFGDGCAASLVTAEPEGIALDSFRSLLVPETRDLITWRIGDAGFDMLLGGGVPAAVGQGLRGHTADILGGAAVSDIDLWAVHPGGRTVLDAVQQALDLPPRALDVSRGVLRDFGNMSSATIMFVLAEMLRQAGPGERGCGMAFGPGLTAETMLFHVAG